MNLFKEYQAHVYEHTSTSNRFQCNMCPYNCKNYSKLKRHMLYHSGARNYECSICGNKFYQMEHLKRHLQSIHHQDTQTTSIQHPKQQHHDGGKRSRSLPRQYLNNIVKPVEVGNNLQQEQTIVTASQPQQAQATANTATTSQQCYKVTSKCMYKCHQCDYSTIKLYSLNEHVINSHLNNSDSLINGLLLCSFCTYTTNKKINLKRHLQNNHSSQTTAPILLSNDALMIHPNTRFQCGLCRRYHSNINEFVKHITEKHKMQVCIIDSNLNENIIQEQLQTRGRAELICTSNNSTTTATTGGNDDLAELSQLTKSNEEIINQVIIIEEEKQQQRVLQQQQQQQQQQTTVRINPALNEMLLKRTLTQQKTRKMIIPMQMPTNNNNTLICNEGLDEAAFAVNQLTNEDELEANLQQSNEDDDDETSSNNNKIMYS